MQLTVYFFTAKYPMQNATPFQPIVLCTFLLSNFQCGKASFTKDRCCHSQRNILFHSEIQMFTPKEWIFDPKERCNFVYRNMSCDWSISAYDWNQYIAPSICFYGFVPHFLCFKGTHICKISCWIPEEFVMLSAKCYFYLSLLFQERNICCCSLPFFF